MVRVLVVEHARDCPPALVGRWLVDAGAELDLCRPYEGDPLPDSLADHDALLVLGGPQDAGDDAHAWLEPTRTLVRDGARRSLPVLGICLGHQLCALALGGEVGRNPRGQQVGLVPTGLTGAAAHDPLLGTVAARTAVRAAQWNDDVVLTAPAGTQVLAATPDGELQAARFAPTVWGVQWHPEVDDVILRRWALDDAERHLASGVDQEAVLAEVAAAGDELEATWRPLADSLVALARDGVPT